MVSVRQVKKQKGQPDMWYGHWHHLQLFLATTKVLQQLGNRGGVRVTEPGNYTLLHGTPRKELPNYDRGHKKVGGVYNLSCSN